MYCLLFIKNYEYTYLFSGTIGSKLIHHGIVLLWNLTFYMIYVGGSEKGDMDMRKYYMYSWDRLECKKLIDSDISDRNKLVIERAKK